MRYFIYFQYDGTRYHGWQIQPNGITVQEELQRALSVVLRRETEVVGAGRTDTGVHARLMVAHFDSPVRLDIGERGEMYKLNRLLPPDISVLKIEEVADDMHARFSAISRTYRYYISTRKTPFLRQYCWQIHWHLDFSAMNEAAELLVGEKDFASFCKVGSDVKTTMCNLTRAVWVQDSDTEWHFEISCNRFLRNMVRAVVGTLVEVGRGRMSLREFTDVLSAKSRSRAGESVPAQGLFLEDIKYSRG
ncbi:MAG: tRNA pseudouridine(38-40) synthase TruA [Bacteroidaceae bacterium]|nr:tRNA pseudouridine(38-40) synthase TruA [Bacteroidaceae bacterium]